MNCVTCRVSSIHHFQCSRLRCAANPGKTRGRTGKSSSPANHVRDGCSNPLTYHPLTADGPACGSPPEQRLESLGEGNHAQHEAADPDNATPLKRPRCRLSGRLCLQQQHPLVQLQAAEGKDHSTQERRKDDRQPSPHSQRDDPAHQAQESQPDVQQVLQAQRGGLLADEQDLCSQYGYAAEDRNEPSAKALGRWGNTSALRARRHGRLGIHSRSRAAIRAPRHRARPPIGCSLRRLR